MKIKKPDFWDEKKPNFFSYLLLPISKIIQILKSLKKSEKLNFPEIKTICVGNIYIGGTGKTPLSIKISKLLNSKNLKTTVIKKFYINQKDEQILINKKTNLISKINRKASLDSAIRQSFKYAILDDGLQDNYINYDLKICCFSSNNWIGNGLTIPSGPLREDINSIKNFDIIFLNGPDIENKFIKDKISKINSNIKIFEGSYKLKNSNNLDISKNYLIFSGIGNPKNFDYTLKENNFKVFKHFTFPDHYNYKKNEIDNLKKFAKDKNLEIITTEKDYFRIQEELRNDINFVEIDLEISNEKELINLIL
tara:strand:+ start:159 stop:1085 length:927 start_codon:yes stop_codon:yes gene_type:complete